MIVWYERDEQTFNTADIHIHTFTHTHTHTLKHTYTHTRTYFHTLSYGKYPQKYIQIYNIIIAFTESSQVRTALNLYTLNG